MLCPDAGGRPSRSVITKWAQVGRGLAQVPLPIGIIEDAYLCNAYVKADEMKERRMMTRLNTFIGLIEGRRLIERGRLL